MDAIMYVFGNDNKLCGTEKTYSDKEIVASDYPASQNHRTFIAPPSYDAATEIPVWNGATWDIHTLSEYVTAELTLDEVKENKRAEIAQIRYDEESVGCAWNGYVVATDRESRSILNTAKAIADEMGVLYTSSTWKMQSGEFVKLSMSDMKSMGMTMAAYIQSLFNKEAELNTKINEAATKEEVNLITWG